MVDATFFNVFEEIDYDLEEIMSDEEMDLLLEASY